MTAKEGNWSKDISESTIEVTDIPTGTREDLLWMIFENKRYGGGYIEDIEYNCGDTRALIKFENPAGRLQMCQV